jgi:hypothetical protein
MRGDGGHATVACAAEALSSEEDLNLIPHGIAALASKMSSTMGVDDKNDSWNTTAKGTPSKGKADDP